MTVALSKKLLLFAVGAVCVGLVVACGSSSSSSSSSTPSSSSANPAKYNSKAPVTLTLWYLGDEETPGFQVWMADTIRAYESLHPNVKIQTTLENINNYIPAQNAACKAQNGPDMWYTWGGTFAMEQAWNGCVIPDEATWPESLIQHLDNLGEVTWQGKHWLFPQWLVIFPILYNKILFARAGLNPNTPPTTYSQLIADAAQLKAHGITPIEMGLKDGYGGEEISVSYQKQVFNNYDQLKQLDLTGNFATDPRWLLWLTKLHQLAPYFNSDADSRNQADVQTSFALGNAAMTFGFNGVQVVMQAMEKHHEVGVMEMPAFTNLSYARSFSTNSAGWQITKWSAHKQAAAAFIAFMHTPAIMNDWYAKTSSFPADKTWSGAQADQDPLQKQMLAWIRQNNALYTTDFIPVDLDLNGNFPVFQGMIGNGMSVQSAANLYESVIQHWRATHPTEAQLIQSWIGSNP